VVLRISVGGFLLSGSKSDIFNTSFDFLFCLLVSVVGSGILVEAKWNIVCERRWVMIV